MAKKKERILVVENDAAESDLISRQTLQPLGYHVRVVTEAGEAIQEALSFSPDVVIANLDLPGLSGKDLMVAFSSQSIEIPVIIISPRGKERDLIQTFRLGASDYVGAPVREAELVSAVERAFNQVRARRERERLAGKLQQTNQKLQQRIRELTTIFSLGKAVTSITNQKELLTTILDEAVKITEANIGWMMLRDERANAFVLSAHRNLPKSLGSKINQPWDDGISSLVALSGKSLSIHGDAFKRFKISALGKAALVTPIVAKKQTIGLLVVLRKRDLEFKDSDQVMLEAVGDYASISLVNSRLFRALDDRASSLQELVKKSLHNDRVKESIVQSSSQELLSEFESARNSINLFFSGELGRVKGRHREVLETTQGNVNKAVKITEAMSLMHSSASPKKLTTVNLNQIAKQAAGRFQKAAAEADATIKVELEPDPVLAQADAGQIALVFDALLSNAVKFSPEGGQINLRVDRGKDKLPHGSVQDNGIGIVKKDLNQIFNRFFQFDEDTGGLGIGLSLVKSIINAHGGEIWAESKLNAGSIFHFTLKPPE
jgi:signal transduction histidine kinase/DNA-binding response OmpR family regulator